jgi:hypothetical protein
MNRFSLLALAATLGAGCSARTDPSGTTTFAGTVRGAPFAPVAATAFVIEPTACTNPEFAGATVTMVQLQFWSYDGACALAMDTSFCGAKASSTGAYVAVFRENVYGGAVPAIGPGTYTDAGTHVVDANGVVTFFWRGVGAYDASCAPAATGMPKDPTGGSLTLEEVGPTRVRGHAELSFDNGDVLSGSFDAPVCPSSDAIQCDAMKGGCTSLTCVP